MARSPNAGTRALIKSFEALRLAAYDDRRPEHALVAGEAPLGRATIGWGHTGPDVFAGQTISEAEAERLFEADIERIAEALAPIVKGVPLNDNEYGAIFSFAWNEGPHNLETASFWINLRSNMRSRAALLSLMWWNRIDGKISAGLERRRAAEFALFFTPVGV